MWNLVKITINKNDRFLNFENAVISVSFLQEDL